MMNRKKASAALLSLVLAASLAACGGSASTGSTGSKSSEASAEAVTESSAAAAESAAEAAEAAAAEAAAAEKAAEEEAARLEAEKAAEEAAKKERELTAYAVYLDILRLNEEMISYYNWQDIRWTEEGAVRRDEPSAVAFADVYGDEIPELLFMKAVDGDYGEYYTASLEVYTLGDNSAIRLYDGYLDVQVAGGTNFSLFATKDGELWSYRCIGDEGTGYYFDHIVMDGDSCESVQYLHKSEYPTEDYSSFEYTFKKEGQDIDEAAYEAEKQAIYDSVDMILMASNCDDETLLNMSDENGNASLTCGAAVGFLEQVLAEEDFARETLDVGTFFGAMTNRGFYFASGVGGWSTSLLVNEDGTFSGSFYDSDMGSTGEGYQYGTIYESNYTGRFTDLRKIDEDTYVCGIADLALDKPEGEEEIRDEVRYISSAPYGISGGENFVIFMPTTLTKEMPESALSWYTMPRALGNDVPEGLGCYGIYNVEQMNGFYSGEG